MQNDDRNDTLFQAAPVNEQGFIDWLRNYDNLPENGVDKEFEADEDVAVRLGTVDRIDFEGKTRLLRRLDRQIVSPDEAAEPEEEEAFSSEDDPYGPEPEDEDDWDDTPSWKKPDVVLLPRRLIWALQSACEYEDYSRAQEYYRELRQFPFHVWPEEAFQFLLDYLLMNPFPSRTYIRQMITEFGNAHPYSEDPYWYEYQLERLLGNRETAYEALNNAVIKTPHAGKCALLLAEEQIERGLYEAVPETCSYGLIAGCSLDAHNDAAYFYALRTIAREGLLRRRIQAGEEITEKEVSVLSDVFERILKIFRNDLSRSFRRDIKAHLAGLQMLKADLQAHTK